MALTADTITRLGYGTASTAAATEIDAAITTAGAGGNIGAGTVTNAMLAGSILNAKLGTAALQSPSPTDGIGYATGAGAAVTQATNRTTGVTCTGLSGAITTNNASLAAEAAAAFTVTNTSVLIGDVVAVSQRSGSNGGDTAVYVSTVAAGSFQITVANNNAASGTAETGAIIINFVVLRGVSA